MVEAALGLVEAADAEGEEFPLLRAGVACGEALPRGGDWYGRPVNLASRITAIARPDSVLAEEAVEQALADDYAWSFAGSRQAEGHRRLGEALPLPPRGLIHRRPAAVVGR